MTQPDRRNGRVLVSSRGHSWTRERLVERFDCVVAEPGEVMAMDEDARAGIAAFATLMSPVTPALIDALPNLRIVSSFGVGYDHVDAAHAARRGVIVTHTPHVLDDEVADTAIGLLLNTLRELPRAETWLRAGKWQTEGLTGAVSS